MSKYLLEIGVEEFPATYIEPTKLQLEEAFTKLLQDNGVDFHALQTAATPRRLVVRIDGLHNRTEGKTTEVRGPAVRIAYDEQGRPTKALAGFMRSQQVQEDGIFTRDVNGESYVFAQKTEEGKDVKQLLRDGIPEILRHLRFPKSMKWGGRDFRFARPIRWFVSLFDDDVLPFDLEEIPVGRFTRGHRVLGSDRIEVESIERFEDQLLDNFVMLDEQKRKELILLQAERLVRERGGNLMQDEALLDEIVNLVEYPTPLLGQIPAEYMDLPDTVILTPMKDHLRYIPVLDDKGDPMPYFVTVRNGDKTGLDTVREGNERVLTPRLEDAKFFYKEDRKQPLEDYVPELENLVFHDKLGNMLEKTNRVRSLARQIGTQMGVGESALASIDRAAYLSKADLVTHMVIEFTELQGIIGGIYAKESGESDVVARAISEHYLPNQSRGALPETTTGLVISLADKLDSLCGLFAAGEKISGSQDQFGIRRMTLGVLHILISNKLDLSLDTLIRDSLYGYVDEKVLVFPYEETKDRILQFFRARLRNRLTEDGYRYDVVDSVLARRPHFIYDVILRISAVEDFLSLVNSAEILQSLTRVHTLAQKAEHADVQENLLETPEEKLLYTLGGYYDEIKEALDKASYKPALTMLAQAADSIDAFLDRTMVMVEDEKVKNNRLALLARTNELIQDIFDPASIVKES
ncbi:MAG: glycine--tRNA ligase subunit beta [Tissierellia bacterium]|jgi:glycyl-tRNA synthetase beta chain|nr:glycine--tRNA ligase subunit beta [Bacillota bacterium]NLK57917.1 glycine--tRNA ligase subunit beta [Tissierellia bacterium]